MKIAVYTDNYFPGSGGTEHATHNLCKNLERLGHQILIFAPDYHRECKNEEFEIFRVKSMKISNNDMMVLIRREYKRILARTKEFAPDIIYYCTASGMARCATRLGKELNLPVVATIHTKFKEAFYAGCKSRVITGALIKSLVGKLNKTDRVVTVSVDMANQLKSYGYKKEVIVIRNGIDHLKKLSDDVVVIDAQEEGKPFKFLFCGHLIKAKNIQFSLKVLGILKKINKLNNFTFDVVGDGNYRKKLEKIVKAEGLEDNVVFHGYIHNRLELKRLYKEDDLFLFPSCFDTDGLVICEAAQMGTPTLTIRGFGASERITDEKNGFIADYNVQDFANKILKIIGDKALYDKVCGNVHTILGDGWTEVARKYEDLFEKCIAEKRQA